MNQKKKLITVLLIVSIGILVWSIWTFFTNAHFEWIKNDRKMYRFQSEASQTTVSEQFNLQSSGFDTKINAILNFRVLSVEKERVRLAFQFSPFEMEIGGKRMPVLENLNSVLFLSEWDLNGNIRRMIFPSEISQKDETLVTQNLLLFQSVIVGSRKKWISKEEDSLGRFIAKYNYTGGKILKSKMRYLKIFSEDSDRSSDDENLKSNIQVSYLEFELEKKSSWIRKGSVREQGELSLNQFEIKYRKNAVLEAIPFQPDMKLPIWAENLTFDEAVAGMTEKPKKELSIQEEADRKRIELEYKGQDIQSVYNKYFINSEKFTDLANMEKMREYLAAFPAETEKIPEMLLKGQIRGHRVMEIIHLLASVGHKEAQSALIKIFSGPSQSANAKMQAIASVLEIRNPNEDILTALWSVYERRKSEQDRDYSSTAILALGSAASNLKNRKDASSQIKEKIASEIREADKEKDSGRTAVLISAVGNTGDSSLLSEISRYASSENRIIRTSLYDSLGNFKDKESLNLLQNGIEKETSPEGRTKIMQSLLRRTADEQTVRKAAGALSVEQDPNTRNHILQYMIQNRKNIPDFKDRMKTALEKENFENNRDLILKAMYSE